MTPGMVAFGGWAFVVTGLFILILGWRDFRKQCAFLRQSVRTTGVVAGAHVEPGGFEDGGDYHHPMIRFSTTTGKEVIFTSPGGRRQPWKNAESVPVRYRPDDPQTAELDSFISIWLFTLVCAVLGVVALGSGIMLVMFPEGLRAE